MEKDEAIRLAVEIEKVMIDNKILPHRIADVVDCVIADIIKITQALIKIESRDG